MQDKIWRFKSLDLESGLKLANRLRISPLTAQFLISRGYDNPQDAIKFLSPSLDDLHDPYLLPGMEDAIERIRSAVKRREKIWIYGDYDVDGATASSMLILAFKEMGVEVGSYIPNRLLEGYGLNCDSIGELAGKGCDLLITVDCGISAVEEVKYANELGIDVIITDHHHPQETLPPAFAVINPKLTDSNYPFRELAGVGVAFKLVQALMADAGCSEFALSLIDLAAIGTIVDVTPLIGENRVIVHYGLEAINRKKRIGLKALCDKIGLDGEVNSYHIAFWIGPRLNAAGRLKTANSVVRLLTTDRREEAEEIAQDLDIENTERQLIEQKILDQAVNRISASGYDRECGIVLANDEWHRGVIGIVASRVVERFYRPTILIAIDDEGIGSGSGRSIPEFDLFNGLKRCSDLLLGFGGHRAAAGIKIDRNKIPEFRERFCETIAQELSGQDLIPKIEIDVETSLELLDVELLKEIEKLEPFGVGNPSPTFAVKSVKLAGIPSVLGRGNEHLRFSVIDGFGQRREVIGWRFGRYHTPLMNKNLLLDLAFQPRLDKWNGRDFLRLSLKDIKIYEKDDNPVFPETNAPFKLVDRRHLSDKLVYLQKLIARNERSLLYVRGEREVDFIKEKVDEWTGSTRAEVIISCDPVEGIDGIRHVVFCHPIWDREGFIERCRIATCSEELTYIHLIFNMSDVEFASKQLAKLYPSRGELEKLFIGIKQAINQGKRVDLEYLTSESQFNFMSDDAIEKGMQIFKELGLIRVDAGGSVELLDVEKVDLADSELFIAGEKIKYESSFFLNHLLWRNISDLWQEIDDAIGISE